MRWRQQLLRYRNADKRPFDRNHQFQSADSENHHKTCIQRRTYRNEVIAEGHSDYPKGFAIDGDWFLEAINSLFQAAKCKARGYVRFRTIRTVIFLIACKLDYFGLNPDVALPT
jgi:hypothetical protein